MHRIRLAPAVAPLQAARFALAWVALCAGPAGAHESPAAGAAAQTTAAAPPSASSAKRTLVAGRVQKLKFYPFRDPAANRWGEGPNALQTHAGNAATRPTFVDLGPYDDKVLFLDVAQLPQFYGVRVLGACDPQLGAALWKAAWDRGDFVSSLVEHARNPGADERLATELADPVAGSALGSAVGSAAAAASGAAGAAAGMVRDGVFRPFEVRRRDGASGLEVDAQARARLLPEAKPPATDAPSIDLHEFEGKALFVTFTRGARAATAKGEAAPDREFIGAQPRGSCDARVGGALWAATRDRLAAP